MTSPGAGRCFPVAIVQSLAPVPSPLSACRANLKFDTTFADISYCPAALKPQSPVPFMADAAPIRPAYLILAALAVAPLGCATCDARVRQAVHASIHPVEALADYSVGCPDVIEVSAVRPELGGRYAVEPDGAIALPGGRRVRVEGMTADEIARQIEAATASPVESVHVTVTRHASRQVLLCGPVTGQQRAVDYRGPETVTQLLARAGGLGDETSPREVQVVRSHVATGQRPEVFRVNLEAIALRGDRSSDVVVQPYDQIYLNQSRRSAVAHCLPPWLTPWCRRSALPKP